MNAASALLRSAESLGIILWVDGDQLRYKARQPVTDGLKNRIREHKAEIINLLSKQDGLNFELVDSGDRKSSESNNPPIPEWCNTGCKCFCRLELPDMDVVQGCYLETDRRNWQWSRIDKMNSCPMATAKNREVNS